MKPSIALTIAALCLAAAPPTHAELVPIDEPGTHGTSDTGDTSRSLEDSIPAHPDARNTAVCNYQGTTSRSDTKYAAFASSLVGSLARSIQGAGTG